MHTGTRCKCAPAIGILKCKDDFLSNANAFESCRRLAGAAQSLRRHTPCLHAGLWKKVYCGDFAHFGTESRFYLKDLWIQTPKVVAILIRNIGLTCPDTKGAGFRRFLVCCCDDGIGNWIFADAAESIQNIGSIYNHKSKGGITPSLLAQQHIARLWQRAAAFPAKITHLRLHVTVHHVKRSSLFPQSPHRYTRVNCHRP